MERRAGLPAGRTMRLDKYLKVSRLIKRRTVANEACDGERVSVNGRQVKASYQVKVGGVIEIGINGELHRLTRSSIIFMPAGMKHLPLSILELRRPILHFSVSLSPAYSLKRTEE